MEVATSKNLQELMQQRSGELDRFEMALQAPKIIQAHTEEIKQVLRFSMILVGIRAATMNAMSEEEKIILIEFLREKYPFHTVAEIKLAFTKAAAHELDIKEVAHYENFTCEYLGRIMSAYRSWATLQNVYLRARTEDREMKELQSKKPEKTYTDEEIVNNNFQLWCGMINKHIEYINPKCFDILLKYGMMPISEEKKVEILNHAKTIIFLYDMPSNKKSELMKDEDAMELLCKKIAVAEYFNVLHNEGITEFSLADNNKANDFT